MKTKTPKSVMKWGTISACLCSHWSSPFLPGENCLPHIKACRPPGDLEQEGDHLNTPCAGRGWASGRSRSPLAPNSRSASRVMTATPTWGGGAVSSWLRLAGSRPLLLLLPPASTPRHHLLPPRPPCISSRLLTGRGPRLFCVRAKRSRCLSPPGVPRGHSARAFLPGTKQGALLLGPYRWGS